MAKYLNEDGLSKVFQLIKTNYAAKSDIPTNLNQLENGPGYITGVTWDDIANKPDNFAVADHTHTTADVTLLTGYTIAASGVSIAATDSLNTALGKLQKSINEKQPAGNYLTVGGTAADSAKLGGIAAADYALLDSPAFTGTPTAPTAAAGTNTTQVATTAFVKGEVDTAVSGLVNSAPAALDTLNELATALGNDPNFATTIATQLGNKVSTDSPNYIKSVSASNHVLTLTKGDDTTVTFNDTTYTFASGTTNGTIAVDGADIAVTGLGTAAYKADTYFALASHSHTGSEVTLTGYSKNEFNASSVGANPYVQPTDTINLAISKLEQWLDLKQDSGSYALSNHNQASNTINAMTGYSKPSSTSAISTSDTLNAAIGKLEAALDDVQASMEALTETEVQTIWNTANS